MLIAERYSTARHTSNLKSIYRTTHAPSDIIGAAGMAAQDNQAALTLWDVTFKGKTGAKLALVELLSNNLAGQMCRQNWRGDPKRITQEVVAWHLHGTCQPCGGRGHAKIINTPGQEDEPCHHCNGVGKMPLPKTDAHTWLADRMGKLQAIAAGKIMQKLATDMDLL